MTVTTGSGTQKSSGSLSLLTASAGTSGVSGSVLLSSGISTAGSSGAVYMVSGTATGGAGGAISLSVGSGNTGAGGAVTIASGPTTATSPASAGGAMMLSTGSGTSSGGDLSFFTGYGSTNGKVNFYTEAADSLSSGVVSVQFSSSAGYMFGSLNSPNRPFTLYSSDFTATVSGPVTLSAGSTATLTAPRTIIVGNTNTTITTPALSISAAATVGSTLGVTGLATLGSLSVTGTSALGSTLRVTGAATLDSTLLVTGLATLVSLSVQGDVTVQGLLSPLGGIRLYSSGTLITFPSAASYDPVNTNYYLSTLPAASDKRLKKDFSVISDPLKKLRNLKGLYFHWAKSVRGLNGGEDEVDQRRAGFLAQDVQQVLPEAVSEIFGGKYLGVNYEAILSLIVEALKELNQKVDDLEGRIAAQERGKIK